MEKIFPTTEARCGQECDLRVRRRIGGRRAGAVSIAVLSLLHYFFDLRRRGGFSGAIRRRLHRFADRRLYRDPGFSAFADRRTGLGMEQRLFKLDAEELNAR